MTSAFFLESALESILQIKTMRQICVTYDQVQQKWVRRWIIRDSSLREKEKKSLLDGNFDEKYNRENIWNSR